MSRPENLLSLVRDYHHDDPGFDVEAILRAGRRRSRRRHALIGTAGLATLAAGSVAVAALISTGSSGAAKLVQPASRALPGHGLLATDPAQGPIETLNVTSSGWKAVVYLNSTGALCQGWIDPATAVLTGECGSPVPLDATPDPTGSTDITPPILVEPQAGVTSTTVEAFGLLGTNTSSVTVTGTTGALEVTVSTVHNRYGQRVWVATFPAGAMSHSLDTVTAHGAQGDAISSVRFAPPTEGAAQSRLSYIATPSPISYPPTM